jgi:hypothetical protein
MPNLTKIVRLVALVYKRSGIFEPVKPGPKKTYSNLYICQLVVVQHLKGLTDESAYLRYVKSHRFKCFPKIPSQQQYNHRAKQLQPITDFLTGYLIRKLKLHKQKIRIIDATGVPVVKYHRRFNTKAFKNKKFFGLGYCAAKKFRYYGVKLTLIVNSEGIPITYHLMPANRHDSIALTKISKELYNIWLIGDKGYIGKRRKEQLRAKRKILLITPYRKNQKARNTKWEKRKLKKRKVVEWVNNQLKDFGQLEQLRAVSYGGIKSRIRNLIFSHLMACYFNKIYHRNVLSIKEILG